MTRFLPAVAALALAGATAPAQDAKPARPAVQPKGIQIQPAVQPPLGVTRVTAAKMALLEEEFETLQANRDVRKAIVKAAEVAVKAAEAQFDLVGTAANNVPPSDRLKAKLEVEAAKAQLEIRLAEMKEVEVRIKFAKKRLDEAKVGGVIGRPNPKVDLKPVDPVPPPPAPPAPDDKAKQLADLKAKLEKATAEAEKAAAESKKAEGESKAAADELAKIKDIATRGRVLPGTIEKAEEKAKAAKDAAEAAKKKVKAAEDEVAAVKAKIKEIET